MSVKKVLAQLSLELNANSAQLKKELQNAKKEVGTFKKTVSSIQSAVVGAFAVGSIMSFGKAVIDNVEKFGKLNTTVRNFSGAQGDAINTLTGEIQGLSETFDENFADIAQAANNLSKNMNVSFKEAVDIIENGFLRGANQSGELLEIIKEYPALLNEAGFSAKEFTNLINAQTKMGIFSDKGIDSIKEAHLRLREMPKATQDALKALGLSSEKIQKEIKSGTISVKDAIKIISEKIKELPPDSQMVGTALADIFGAAGEDAGKAWIDKLSENMSKTEEVALTAAQQSKKELLDANQELATAWSRIFGSQSEGWQKIKTWAVKGTTALIKAVRSTTAAGMVEVATEDAIDKVLKDAAEQNKEGLKNAGIEIGKKVGEGIDLGISEVVKMKVPKAITGLKPDSSSLSQIGEQSPMVSGGDMLEYSKQLLEQSKLRAEQIANETNAWNALGTTVTETFLMNATGALTSFGEALGNVFATGKAGFKDMVGSMLKGLQQIITGLLAQAIAGIIAGEASKGVIGLAIAAVGIGALTALWQSKVPKFELGGIVPGSSYVGDNMLVRANSGEMILNQGQQSNLFRMLNSGFTNNNNFNGDVRFEIEGDKLVGVLSTRSKKQLAF